MALSTYAELQAAVADWMERSDLTARIPDFIRLAEAQMNRVLRVRPMMMRSTATIGDPFSELPGDFLEAIVLTLSDGNTAWTLQPAPPEVVARWAVAEEIGRPRYWSGVGAELRYYPSPSVPVTASLTYYAKIPALTEAAPSNWILKDHPDAYLFGALKEAAPFLRDAEMTATFEAKHQAAMAAILSAERTRVGPLRSETPESSWKRTFDINLDR